MSAMLCIQADISNFLTNVINDSHCHIRVRAHSVQLMQKLENSLWWSWYITLVLWPRW